jgi:histidinol-phosphatase (PHP family)
MQNLHTHTTYVDGKLSAEKMILEAIDRGCQTLGFSEHSFVPFDEYYSMNPEMTVDYMNEINTLKKKYEGKIDVFLGLELDFFTTWWPKEGLEYILATSHYAKVSDEQGNYTHFAIDSGFKRLNYLADAYYGGDYYSIVEAYYKTVSGLAKKAKIDIVGHFDLIAKYNYDNEIFDEEHPRYIKASLRAMEILLESCKLFEVNTGAMYRVDKTEPYPSKFLLKELYKRGGEVVITSDSHDAESLCFKYDEMRDLLKSIGFKTQKRLTNKGFVDEML